MYVLSDPESIAKEMGSYDLMGFKNVRLLVQESPNEVPYLVLLKPGHVYVYTDDDVFKIIIKKHVSTCDGLSHRIRVRLRPIECVKGNKLDALSFVKKTLVPSFFSFESYFHRPEDFVFYILVGAEILATSTVVAGTALQGYRGHGAIVAMPKDNASGWDASLSNQTKSPPEMDSDGPKKAPSLM